MFHTHDYIVNCQCVTSLNLEPKFSYKYFCEKNYCIRFSLHEHYTRMNKMYKISNGKSDTREKKQ